MINNNTVFSHHPIVSWYMIIQGEVNFLFSILPLRRLYELGSACEILNANYKIFKWKIFMNPKSSFIIL